MVKPRVLAAFLSAAVLILAAVPYGAADDDPYVWMEEIEGRQGPRLGQGRERPLAAAAAERPALRRASTPTR